MKEINERIYPYSVGVDFYNKEDKKNLYNVSFTYPNIDAMGKDPQSEETTFVLAQTARNIFDASHKLTIRNSQSIDMEHLKVLLICEEIGKDGKRVKQMIDGLSRGFDINKIVKLLIVEGCVEDFLQVKKESKRQETKEGSIYSLLRNLQDSTRFIPNSLSEFIEDMDYCKSSYIPIGKISKDENTIQGVGIFKDYELVGRLNKEESRYLSLLIGHVENDGLDVMYKENDLTLEIRKANTKRRFIESKDKIKIKFTTTIKAQIHQYIMSNGHEIDSKEDLNNMEKAMNKKVEYNMKKVIDKIQKDFNADILGVYQHLNRYHPKLWNKIKDDWDREFPKIEIEFESDVKIKRRGLTS